MLELFGGRTCPFSAELREQLEFDGHEFVYYDVESDAAARERLELLTASPPSVPVLVEDGSIIQVGWQGRSCYVGSAQ